MGDESAATVLRLLLDYWAEEDVRRLLAACPMGRTVAFADTMDKTCLSTLTKNPTPPAL